MSLQRAQCEVVMLQLAKPDLIPVWAHTLENSLSQNWAAKLATLTLPLHAPPLLLLRAVETKDQTETSRQVKTQQLTTRQGHMNTCKCVTPNRGSIFIEYQFVTDYFWNKHQPRLCFTQTTNLMDCKPNLSVCFYSALKLLKISGSLCIQKGNMKCKSTLRSDLNNMLPQ